MEDKGYIEFKIVQPEGMTAIVRFEHTEVTADELVGAFRAFMLAATFSPETVDEALGKEA
jgi:hypothetical protein